MTKLLYETKAYLQEHGLTGADVKWVGSIDGNYAMSWDEFENRFGNLEYDSGFGSQEIAKDLVVVGEGWWLERHEYDGSERWEYKKLPSKSDTSTPFDRLIGCWDNLSKINNTEEEE